MLKRIVAISALGLAMGLAACDQPGQEQAQQPSSPSQEKTQPGAQPSQPTAPSGQEQKPSESR